MRRHKVVLVTLGLVLACAPRADAAGANVAPMVSPRVLETLAHLFEPPAQSITIPNTFVNGTVADATQVNANFTSLSSNAVNRNGGTMLGTLNSRAVTPTSDATYDLATSALQFRDGWFSRNGKFGGTLTVLGATTLTGGLSAPLAVAQGGTALASGTSGGVLGYTAAGTLASSAALTQHGLVVGGGAGATPTALAVATTGQFFIGVTGADPTARTLTGSDLTSAGGVRVLDRLVALTTLVSSTTETAMYSFSVPGGTLSTNKSLRLTLWGDYLNNTGGNDTFTLRVKYGGTTIETWTASISNGAGANRRSLHLDARLSAANGTGAQSSYARAAIGNNAGSSATGTMLVANSDNGQPVEGTNTGIAEDSTAAKTFQVTFQLGTNSASVAGRVFAAFLELLE